MKANAVSLLVVGLFVFAAATPIAAVEVTQTTGNGSWCSPALNGSGNIVICNGVDPRAMDRLNELLDRKDLDLKQRTAEANDWAHRYNELNAQLEETKKQLAAKGQDATLVQTAQDLLHEGNLEEAHAIFDRLIQSDEANVDRAAEDHFGRASVFALQFRLDKALPDYAKAYQYRPDDRRYASAYSYALNQERDYHTAELVLQSLLKQQRSFVAQNPSVNRADLATTLNDLGLLERETHRPVEAEAALKEAASIRRELAAQNLALLPDLAGTLNNVGIVYWNANHFAEAEAAYKEAAAILRELAARNATAYLPIVAATLNNLGNLYDNIHSFAAAEGTLKEAAAIRRNLAAQNPAAYRPDLAATLNNLGDHYREAHGFAEAEATFNEAAGIYSNLAAQNPAAYRPDWAATLGNLGNIYADKHQFAASEAAYKNAVAIQRDLVAQSPLAYRPDLALTLSNLGTLFDDMRDFADAEATLNEAAAIYRDLATESLDTYRPHLERTLKNLASMYREIHRDTDAKGVEAEALAASNGSWSRTGAAKDQNLPKR
jgi:tetratricopeptide (TPR) repeat protein